MQTSSFQATATALGYDRDSPAGDDGSAFPAEVAPPLGEVMSTCVELATGGRRKTGAPPPPVMSAAKAASAACESAAAGGFLSATPRGLNQTEYS